MAMRHFMESKVLALAVIMLFIATLVCVFSSLSPFWYRLHFGPEDATYGSEAPREADLQIGMFWIYKPEKLSLPTQPERNRVLMTSLIAMDEAVNLPVVPAMFKLGQVFYSIGVFGIAAGWSGGMILACRKTGSITGNTGLAIFASLAALFQVLGVVFPLYVTLDSSSTWHTLPLEDPYRIVITAHPTMYIEWGYYIALIGAVISVVGAVLLIIDAKKLCKSVENIRNWQRKTKPAPEPYPDIRYQRFTYEDVPRPKPVYASVHAPVHSQGAVLMRGPPQPFIAQPQPSPQPPRYREYQEYNPHTPSEYKTQYSPRPPPDYSAEDYKAEEAGYVSRQVDL